jgi:hypothetical protein
MDFRFICGESLHRFTPIFLKLNQRYVHVLHELVFSQDAWLYHLTIVSGKGPSAGTQFEQLIHKLMEVDGDPSNSIHAHENST